MDLRGVSRIQTLAERLSWIVRSRTRSAASTTSRLSREARAPRGLHISREANRYKIENKGLIGAGNERAPVKVQARPQSAGAQINPTGAWKFSPAQSLSSSFFWRGVSLRAKILNGDGNASNLCGRRRRVRGWRNFCVGGDGSFGAAVRSDITAHG